MPVYHLTDSNTDGYAPCPAKKKCRLGTAHFDTLTDAIQGAELDFKRRHGGKSMTTVHKEEFLNKVFAKPIEHLEHTLEFTEPKSDSALKTMTAQGEKADYTIKQTASGKTFLHYKKEGKEVRTSTLHDSLDEALTAAQKFEQSCGGEKR